ncbi:hypothetical protein DL96DRAFT_1713750 [Flagelloscypha sp. PMI_526]|nr:hypothetical protein DL96DRAFT_1713750 [Flagelloscypha sp. PMI_526]
MCPVREPLPNELVHEIVSHLDNFSDEDVVKAVQSVALVARRFTEPCQRLLYSRIHVAQVQRLPPSHWIFHGLHALFLFLEKYPHLGTYTLYFSIDQTEDSWIQLGEAARLGRLGKHLPNLVAACFTGHTGETSPALGQNFGISIFNTLPVHLTTLILTLHIEFASAAQFISLFGRLTALRTLHLGWVFIEDQKKWNGGGLDQVRHKAPCFLESLQLEGNSEEFVESIVDYLLDPSSPHSARHLKRLSMRCEDKSLLARLLREQTSPSQLRQLDITHLSDDWGLAPGDIELDADIDWPSLEHFDALTDMRIMDLKVTESIRWMLSLFKCSSDQTSIKTIRFSFKDVEYLELRDMWDPEAWRELDKMMTRFCALESVTIFPANRQVSPRKISTLLEDLDESGKLVIDTNGYCSSCDDFERSDDSDNGGNRSPTWDEYPQEDHLRH